MGLKLEGLVQSPSLGIGGSTEESFLFSGKISWSMDMLNRHVSIGVMLRAVPLSIFAEIPSGPLALSVIYGFKVGWYLVIRWILITC